MSSSEKRFGVWLDDRRVGTIRQQGDRTQFTLDEEYRGDPERPVLGLVFEDRPTASHAAAVRLAPWFSNLLPEGQLRAWIARERNVNRKREMELLSQVGHDLPGAVRVLAEDEVPIVASLRDEESYPCGPFNGRKGDRLQFSLAGVAMKFSMLKRQGQLVLPAHGKGGDWIVKLPDRVFRDVPRNEFVMMSLASSAGIDVPEIELVHRDSVDKRVPGDLWPESESYAYAIRRFDREEGGHRRIHIEDLAQVRNFYPERKYFGSFETVANLIYRRHDVKSLIQFVRRLTFSILISNGDAHLKNWSLIYRNPQVPELAPAYDLVATGFYPVSDMPERLALKFGDTRNFHRISLGTFSRLQEKLAVGGGVDLAEHVVDAISSVLSAWPKYSAFLDGNEPLQEFIDRSTRARASTLMKTKLSSR
ncbi:type II toxin-antitoxin system HipA family toxin [Lentzea chajnantorensis]